MEEIKETQEEKKSKKEHWKKFVIFFFLIAIMAVGINRYFPTRKTMDLENQYYKIGENVDGALIVGNQNTGMGIKREGESIYFPLEAVQTYINERFYWDGQYILYTLPEETITYIPGKRAYETEAGKGYYKYIPVILEEEQVWLEIRLIEQYTNITWSTQDNGIWVWNCWDTELTYAQLKYDMAIRYAGDPKSPILVSGKKGDSVQVLDTSVRNWTKVQTAEGIIGYIWRGALAGFYTETKHQDFQEPEYTSLSLGEDVVLMWHQNLYDSGLAELPAILENRQINVIAPSWFTIADSEGQIVSRADKAYTEKAHEAGVRVWAMLDNINIEIDDTKLLSNTESRRHLVDNVMEAAINSGIDGINIDLESIEAENGPAFTQLIREFSVACRKAGLMLSVDNYVPITSNLYYNRQEQAEVVDYIIMMGYDEHWAGSEPGSTASYSFVKNGIVRSLQEVPEEKLILAVPFYTRLWTIEDGVVSSKAIGMNAIPELIAQWHRDIQWLEKEQQHYAEFRDGKITQKLWIEDADSMAWKLELAKAYNLAGVAIWKAGFGSEDIWDLEWKQK